MILFSICLPYRIHPIHGPLGPTSRSPSPPSHRSPALFWTSAASRPRRCFKKTARLRWKKNGIKNNQRHIRINLNPPLIKVHPGPWVAYFFGPLGMDFYSGSSPFLPFLFQFPLKRRVDLCLDRFFLGGAGLDFCSGMELAFNIKWILIRRVSKMWFIFNESGDCVGWMIERLTLKKWHQRILKGKSASI